MKTYFTDFFDVDPAVLETYGAFNVSLVTDLPLFIDPFLLFNSKKGKYQDLHADIVRYLIFLREKAQRDHIDDGLLKSWYFFSEVRQNWLGFTIGSNRGSGLGKGFATSLHGSLHHLFPEFGLENESRITRGTHLEKLCLVRDGVGRDNISDFTTNLIKGFLCDYTQEFAQKHIHQNKRKLVAIPKTRFNYVTETWETVRFELPFMYGDYVILSPKDLLTKDDTWINKHDLINSFPDIPPAIPDEQLRAQINNYFRSTLEKKRGKPPTQQEQSAAAARTIRAFPALIDYYIKLKEERGDQAESVSSKKVRISEHVYVDQIRALQSALDTQTPFYEIHGNTYSEALARLHYLKDLIENKGCHKIFYINGQPVQREEDLHIMYRLVWAGTPHDVSREVNDGRGPADFKISQGVSDKTIVEFKLAKNTQLERNLEKQAEIYQKASDAKHAIKAIMFFSRAEQTKVTRILKKLGLEGKENIVLIDARKDNKPSASKA